MDEITSLFLGLLVTLATVGAVAVGRRRSSGVNANPRHCANCQTPMSLRRVSLIQSLMFRGGWMCPHCGTRLHKRQGKVTGAPS
jgi:hypothetical protein